MPMWRHQAKTSERSQSCFSRFVQMTTTFVFARNLLMSLGILAGRRGEQRLCLVLPRATT
eukprot:15440350-Alexandrium_andersonii.AAC.1